MRFNVKSHGQVAQINPVVMEFSHRSVFGINVPEAYETLIASVMTSEKSLFTSWEETQSSWKIIDYVLECMKEKKTRFPNYTPGRFGPDEADLLLKKDGKYWI